MINKIFHLDMDCFFAAVEMLKNEKLKSVPLAVGQKMKEGIVSSANYIARKEGVKAAMPIYKAKKICPRLVVVDSDMKKYIEISSNIDTLLRKYVKNVERGSIDEWYIDVSNSQFESWSEWNFACFLKNNIKNNINLDCSIGNSFTVFLAKIATDICKPNGFLTLDKNNYKDYLIKLELKDLLGIGSSTISILNNDFNIHTVQDLYNTKNDVLIRKKLGSSWSKLIFNINGIETNKVNNIHKKRNIGKSQSIKNYSEYNEFQKLLFNMIDEINISLKKENFYFKSFNLKIKLGNKKYYSESFFYNEHVAIINKNDVITIFDNTISTNEYNLISNVSLSVNDLLNRDYFKEQKSIFDCIKISNDEIENIILDKVNTKFNKKVLFRANSKQK